MVAPAPGQPLEEMTGLTSITVNPGLNSTEAHGMDDAHGFHVPVKSTPSMSFERRWDMNSALLFKAMEQSDSGGAGVPFADYPVGQDDPSVAGISGTGLFKPTSAQSLSDPITNAVEVMPAAADWVFSGVWT